ncbi:sensor histidine kinase, partial [Kitasatospora sp. NPDC059571]|uniref:sensor histidine kinase n=1 Tax=Kitasatospora sp. NPDC059571 TaxID=3346871 RepID=UPI00369AB9E6
LALKTHSITPRPPPAPPRSRPPDPGRSREALELIAGTGRQALGEIRRLLGVLRERDEGADFSPQPGIAALDALCARIRAAGPRVAFRTAGDPQTLDPAVQLTVYRIAQEALTNALKHAGAGTCAELRLAVGATEVRLSVYDTGPPGGPAARPHAAPAGGGHGIAGMCERAALYDGSVTAGPLPGGGWAVEAVLLLTPLPVPEGRTP